MKKETLVAQLEAAKTLSSTVDIDKVISLINQIESEIKIGLTQELADEIANKIERTLDYNASDLVDKDNITFDIVYGNQLEIDDAQIDVSETMDHITAILDEFVVEEDEDEDDECGPSETEIVKSINQGLGLDNLNRLNQEGRQGI
jgi:LytS/YehU family sensor histidine kinase